MALSQRPWSFVASIAMAASFVCNGLTPVVVGKAVDEAIATTSLNRLGFWIIVLAGLYLLAAGVSWIAVRPTHRRRGILTCPRFASTSIG